MCVDSIFEDQDSQVTVVPLPFLFPFPFPLNIHPGRVNFQWVRWGVETVRQASDRID